MPDRYFEFHIDFDNDGLFAGTYDDVSSYVMEAKWRWGMSEPYQLVNDEQTIKMTLNNEDGRFNPENSSSPVFGKFMPWREVRVGWVFPGGTATMINGWIELIRPENITAGAQSGKTTCLIECVGINEHMKRISYDLGVFANTNAASLHHVAIKDRLNASGITVASALAEATYTTFPSFGDTMTGSLFDAWSQAAESERGFAYIGQQKVFYLRERYWHARGAYQAAHGTIDYTQAPVLATELTDTGGGWVGQPEYRYGEDIYNSIVVELGQRSNTSSITLWSLQKSITIQPSSTETMYVYLRDADGQLVSSSSLSAANEAWTGVTGTIVITEEGNRAKLAITNNDGFPTVLTAMDITGVAIQDRDQFEVRSTDATSIATYGERELRINTPALQDQNVARGLGLFELARRKDPRGIVTSIERYRRSTEETRNYAQTYGPGSLLVITMPNGHSGKHIVIGQAYEWSAGGSYKTKYFLEPIGSQVYWFLGQAGATELGQTTVLAY